MPWALTAQFILKRLSRGIDLETICIECFSFQINEKIDFLLRSLIVVLVTLILRLRPRSRRKDFKLAISHQLKSDTVWKMSILQTAGQVPNHYCVVMSHNNGLSVKLTVNSNTEYVREWYRNCIDSSVAPLIDRWEVLHVYEMNWMSCFFHLKVWNAVPEG